VLIKSCQVFEPHTRANANQRIVPVFQVFEMNFVKYQNNCIPNGAQMRRGTFVSCGATKKPAMRDLAPSDSSENVLSGRSTVSRQLDTQYQQMNGRDLVPMTYKGLQEQKKTSSTFSSSMMVAGFEEDADASGRALEQDYKYTWSQDDYSETKRTIDTWSFVLTLRARLWLLDQPLSYIGGFTEEKKSARARSLAIWIRESILQLGPTFIKIGQLFSTRSDLFPAEFVEELSKLQDRVPAFSAEKAIATIENELGGRVNELFAEFDDTPIAAASLGQVHVAKLWTGEKVVVKVQRPGLKRLFDIDLENLRLVATQLDKGDEGDGSRDFLGIYEECAKILYEEIDYINEGKNADKFRRNFKPEGWVKVPKVYWQRTSSSVLTMEYLPGPKVTDLKAITASGLNSSLIARRATEAYLIQILKHGFFHADPHPGNIAIDVKNGSLIFYDFGMMGTINPNIKERLLDLFYGIAQKDVDAVLENLTLLGIITPTSSDTIGIRRALSYFVENIGRQAEEQETVAAIGEDLFSIAIDSPFRFPATFTFVLRAFATLEGIGKALDPEFSFAETAAPYAQELLDVKSSQSQQAFILDQLTSQATEVGAATAAMPLRIQKIERSLRGLELGDWKPRVKVLESERAARRASIMQVATLHAIASMGFFNGAIQFGLEDKSGPAFALMGVSAIFSVLVLLSMRRVRRLDKFEKGLKGKGPFPSQN
jgi:predicted unusual protein kinase regulating ubiquinone biosynthesis (AarF/ABC1/UbiB family)